jgi:hypothetical protein
MSKCEWEKIDDFRSPGEFRKFLYWMQNQVAAGLAEEVEVEHPYINAPSLKEKWFMHVENRCIWRIVWPDGPFTGLFEKV